MSQKIDDVLEVLRRIRSSGGRKDMAAAKQHRIHAIHQIARDRAVAYQTIADAYLRRLRPGIADTSAFDRLVHQWLNGNAGPLKQALWQACLDREDERNVTEFFVAR